MESNGESSKYSCPKVVTYNPEHLPARRAALTKTSENSRLLKAFFFQRNIFLKEYSVSPHTKYFLKRIYMLKTTILNKTRKHTERQKFQEDTALAQYQLLCDSSQRTHTFPPPLQTLYKSLQYKLFKVFSFIQQQQPGTKSTRPIWSSAFRMHWRTSLFLINF